MCFSQPTVNIPAPPPLPTPPNPNEALNKANEAQRRKALGQFAPLTSTVMTSPLGDTNYGTNISSSSASSGGTGSALGGTKLGGN